MRLSSRWASSAHARLTLCEQIQYKHMFPSSSIMKWTSSGLTFQTVYQSVTFAWSPQGTPVFNYPKPEPKWTIKSTLDFLKSPFFVLGGFFAIYATNLLSRSDLGGGLEIDLLKAFISFVVMIFSAVIVHAGLKPMTAGLSLPGHSMRILFYIFGGSHVRTALFPCLNLTCTGPALYKNSVER